MNIAPVFSIQVAPAPTGISARVRLSLTHDDCFRVKTYIGSVTASSLDEISIEADAEGDSIAVVLMVDGAAKSRLATVTPTAALTAPEKDLFVARLANELDSAFGHAIFEAGDPERQTVVKGAMADAVRGGTLTYSPTANADGIGRGWIARGMLAAALLLAIGLIAFGVYRQTHRAGGAPGDAFAMAGASNNPLEAKVKAEIDDAVKNPSSMQGYNGMNVAIATMKAMGLNPGKANAGCLVGVGK